MKIKRKKLLNDLQDFASRGDGVIIGSPGIGKTYVLKELRQCLKSSEIPHLLLRIDQLGDGTAETLRQELSYEGNLIEKLKSVSVSNDKAILLFDAFDAARDEETRNRFLKLIQRAIHELKESWNIIVTVRTYDAKKSQELLDLFGNVDDTDPIQYQSKDILCRHFTIPVFNKDEILQALDQIECPRFIYNENSDDFKNILANPFNLWLLEKILKSLPDTELSTLSQIRSEVQLLDMFWHRRVETTDNEIDRLAVLEGIANKMVEQRSLSIKQSNIRKILTQTAWNDLQSDEILTKVSSTRQRIAFSHNILFDYAISVLLIDDEPQELEKFIRDDLSRPLFLRPSLTYFFTRLWYYKDSESFWKAFWHIFPSDQSVHLRLVARLIPTSVIANEASDIEQLQPLLEKLKNGEKIAKEAVTRLLQALQTLQIKRDALWINFFDEVSLHLHEDFAWDLANLTSAILERTSESENSEVVNACGRVGRRLLEWVWQKREAGKNTWYDRFGGRSAVPLVAQTYHTKPEKSRMLLEKILELPQEDNFPITFLSWLTRYVDKIWDNDPEFVTLIYHTAFHHNESRDAKTSLSSGVLAMTSTRRQDYSMCRYRLIKHFSGFLQAAPLSATQAVIRSLNVFIVGEHVVRYLRAGVELEDMIEIFNFRGKPAYFMEDGSYIWDEQEYTDEPIEMADALFEYIGELAMSEDPRLDSFLDVFCDEVVVAFFWKRLLKTGAQFPKFFAPRLFELCIARPILMGNDPRCELRLFLETAAPEFRLDQRRQIEKNILALPEEATDEDSHNALVYRRNRLLERIPENLLVTDEAKQIRKKMVSENDIQENRPLVSFSTQTEAVPEEKWFQTQGVDITKSENQGLQRFSAPLNKFSSDWMNGVPTMEASKLVLPQLRKAHTTVKDNTEADEKVMNSLWHKLTACVAILGRIANKLENSEFSFCRKVLLEAAKHEEPKRNPEYDDHFDSPGYSPCARHEAASGLLRFAFYQPDTKILNAIETLASDRVPSVRMVTAMELFLVYFKAPERFWHIMDKRAAHERNRVVQKFLYHTLTRVVAREKENEEKTIRVMAKLLEHTPPPTEGLEPSDSFIILLMWLRIDRQNSWAFKTIENTYFKDPIRFAKPLSRAVSEVVRDYVQPKHLETEEGRRKAKRAIEWLGDVIDLVSDRIKELHSIAKKEGTEENVKRLHDTYNVIDEVITRLYFAIAHKRDQSEKPVEEISDDLRRDYYNEVKPLMQQVIDVAQDQESGIMFAPTAHYFMQLLRSFLGCNPKEVLHLAAGVVKSSEKFGYTLDTLAVREVVEFVEIILADYRHEVRDGEALEDLLNLLDLFAKIGWSDALKLVWRLDEVFR